MTTRTGLRYEGKAKRVWETTDPTLCIIEYTDGATAFNGEKRAVIAGKGSLNNTLSAAFMNVVEAAGVPTHFVELLNDTEHLAYKVDIVPIEVIVRRIVAGSLARRLGLTEGTPLAKPIVEFCYKRDDLGDPLLTRAHIRELGLASSDTLDLLEAQALRAAQALTTHLAAHHITLVDLKFEFGYTASGELLLADEISPDTCRLWDTNTGERLDKDRFRRDLGDLIDGYSQVLQRIGSA